MDMAVDIANGVTFGQEPQSAAQVQYKVIAVLAWQQSCHGRTPLDRERIVLFTNLKTGKFGGGGGSRTRVRKCYWSRDYMLIPVHAPGV
jgi:hypothetical protein